jgi:hypothetical protein
MNKQEGRQVFFFLNLFGLLVGKVHSYNLGADGAGPIGSLWEPIIVQGLRNLPTETC